MFVSIWSSLIMLLHGFFLLFSVVCCIYVFNFCCRGWSQTESTVNHPWAASWNIFRVSQGRLLLLAVSTLALPWDLVYHCPSQWLTGVWHIRHLSEPMCLGLFCFWRISFCPACFISCLWPRRSSCGYLAPLLYGNSLRLFYFVGKAGSGAGIWVPSLDSSMFV